jgi:hypothetical protein
MGELGGRWDSGQVRSGQADQRLKTWGRGMAGELKNRRTEEREDNNGGRRKR